MQKSVFLLHKQHNHIKHNINNNTRRCKLLQDVHVNSSIHTVEIQNRLYTLILFNIRRTTMTDMKHSHPHRTLRRPLMYTSVARYISPIQHHPTSQHTAKACLLCSSPSLHRDYRYGCTAVVRPSQTCLHTTRAWECVHTTQTTQTHQPHAPT